MVTKSPSSLFGCSFANPGIFFLQNLQNSNIFVSIVFKINPFFVFIIQNSLSTIFKFSPKFPVISQIFLHIYVVPMNKEKWNKSWAIKLDYELFLNTVYTANIFNVIFTLFTCVPLSSVIPIHFIGSPNTVEKCKHWFTVVYCNIYIVMCMANTCNFYTFSRVSQLPLYIFAVQ